MTSDVDAAQLAAYDQALAGSMEYVDGLVDAYRGGCTDTESDNDAVNVVVCAAALYQELGREVLAGALAVALMRLAKVEVPR